MFQQTQTEQHWREPPGSKDNRLSLSNTVYINSDDDTGNKKSVKIIYTRKFNCVNISLVKGITILESEFVQFH